MVCYYSRSALLWDVLSFLRHTILNKLRVYTGQYTYITRIRMYYTILSTYLTGHTPTCICLLWIVLCMYYITLRRKGDIQFCTCMHCVQILIKYTRVRHMLCVLIILLRYIHVVCIVNLLCMFMWYTFPLMYMLHII